MYRVALALMLGMACFLVAYGQFSGLPGHVDASPSLAAVIQEALVACISSDAGFASSTRHCPAWRRFSRLNMVSTWWPSSCRQSTP
jgi:hypothetical protein